MARLFLTVGVVAPLLAVVCKAQVLPPGYAAVVQITNDNAYNRGASMNNRGQIAFPKWINPNDPSTSEIYLYDNGVVTRLTEDNVRDDFPSINDRGEVAWSRAIGSGGTFEVVLWRAGNLTRLTDDGLDDWAESINNQGWVAWHKSTEDGCIGTDADIYVYDGQSVQRITHGGYSNQWACLNDLGDLVWTRYNDCVWPWRSAIMYRTAGVAQPLTDERGCPQGAQINNRRVVAWFSEDPPLWNQRILVWQNGVARELTDWGRNLALNDRGDIAFIRWHDESQTWQLWLYRDGWFWQITSDPFWNIVDDIDERANITWHAGNPFDVDLRLLKRYALGDLNCDRVVNNFDIDPFVLALTDPITYAQVYPKCDFILGDINGDLVVNNFDIDPFVELLSK